MPCVICKEMTYYNSNMHGIYYTLLSPYDTHRIIVLSWRDTNLADLGQQGIQFE